MLRTFLILATLPLLAAEPTRDPDSGIYAIWLGARQSADLPYIKGGQVVAQWRAVEPAEGRYDFSSIDQQLAAQQKLGRKVTIQINGNQHPDWLFSKVPFTPRKLSIQVSDQQGTLAYWHPVYRAAYFKLIAAYGAHMKSSPLRASVIGIRLNFNGLGTEHLDVPEEDRVPSAWTVPPGVSPPAVWSHPIATDYRRAVVDAFIQAFAPDLRVFVRNNIFGGREEVDPEWVRMLEAGQLGLFHTSSEMEPRPGGVGQYEAFIRYCRSGQTLCYAEPWADAWGNHGGKKDPRWCGPEQFNYWRVLVDLNCGVSYCALYGADLAHASEPEFRAAFDFGALYAGYHASPSTSPGAWVAFREGNTLKGDYTFLMKREPGDMKPVQLAGPANQRYGAWARILAAGASARFTLDPIFARSIEGHPVTLRVIYLDTGSGSFTAEAAAQRSTILLKNTGRWQVAEIALKKMTGAGIMLSAGRDVTLHMVEVRR